MARLGDVCEVINGFAFKSEQYVDSGIRIIRIANVQKGYLEDAAPVFYPSESKEAKKYSLVEDDILMSLTGNVGRVAKLSREFLPAALNQRVACLRIKDGVDIDKAFLFNLLNSDYFEQQCISASKGVAQKNMSTEWLKEYEIPIFSLERQRLIAGILDKTTELISLRKQQLAKLDELVKSRFVEIFGDLETNPKGYEQRKLGSLANKISDGVHAKPEYTETGRPFISVVNINKGVIDFEECKFVSEDAYQKMIKSTHPERGDILYTKVGATYGIPAYVDTDTEFCLYVSVCLIKPKHDEIDARFLALSMSMPYIKRQADSRIKGIGVPDLHLNQIREFDVICPPRHEQEAFVTFVEQIDKSKFAVQQSIEKLETLKKSLMQQYFG